ncbi:hypothetical protein TeGR_g840, partial [Tetraparma gracilis]
LTELMFTINVLRAASRKYRFLDELFVCVVRNKTKRSANQAAYAVTASLSSITSKEASLIGKSLVGLLMSNQTGSAAVEEFILTYPALTELDAEFAWFRPTLVAIADELMGKVAYGVKVRAAIGATFSIMDMVSDTVIIVDYYATGRSGYANLMVGLVLGNIIIQILIVYVQSRSIGNSRWRTFFFDSLAVVTFVKPGLDAWKVASGQEQLPGAALDPLVEMMFGKTVEMVFEGIPGMVVQCIAFVESEEKSMMAILSLLISAASTGMTSTVITFDIDIDPTKRKNNPKWMGLIPNVNRGLAFGNLFVITTTHIIAKGIITALLAVTNSAWMWLFMACDYGLYIAYTFVRSDVSFFVPVPAKATIPFGIAARIILKTVVDFTGCLFFRIPMLVGGSWFTFDLAKAQISVLVVAYLYNEFCEDVDGKMDPNEVWGIAGGLFTLWLVAFSHFVLRVAVPEYRHTIWSTQTGWQTSCAYFLENEDDKKRVIVFHQNRAMWEGRIGGEVKAWVRESWDRWERDEPEWLKKVTPTIPDDLASSSHNSTPPPKMGLHLTKYLDDFDMPASSLPTASQLSLLKRLNSELNTPCTDCQDDLLLLRQVWETVVSPAEFPSPDFSIPSPLWSDHLGFQSPNPISDIRGGGRLSARCLLHFVRSDMGRSIVAKARKRRDEAVEELGNEGRPDSFASYPLAPALINMTRFIAHILGVAGEHGQPVDVSKKRSPFYSLLKSERDFAVAVTGAMHVLDSEWERCNATYMDFPFVIERAKNITETMLLQTVRERQQRVHSN